MPDCPIPPDVKATIRFYPKNENGRETAVCPPFYTPILKIEGLDDCHHCCRIYWHGVEQLQPGETADVTIKFLAPELFADKLSVGQKFKMREDRYVGEGEITELLFEKKDS